MFQPQLDGSYTPELAESFTVSDDGKVWTFKIREGVKFHDGQPLTAEDIAFSYNMYKAHVDFPFLNTYTTFFDSIEAPDAGTLVINLTEAIPNAGKPADLPIRAAQAHLGGACRRRRR